MTYQGHVLNGQITLDDAVLLPEGAVVQVQLVRQTETAGDDLLDVLMRHAGKGRDLPSDLAEHHDHYAHGKPID